MKTVIFLFIAISLNAKILEVKQLFNFKTVSVKKEVVQKSRAYYGKTAIDEQKIKEISLRFDAFVTKLYADKSYLYIKRGEPLFRLYSKEALSLIEEFKISKKISQTALKRARFKLRLLDLKNLNKLSKTVYDFDFISPYEGYIIEKNVFEGGFAKRGKILFKIADFSSLWVIAEVYQSDLNLLKEGMYANVFIDGFGKIDAKVDFIYPKADPKTKTIQVRLVIDNKKNIFPGLFAKIELIYDKKERLILPKSAILQKGDKSFVFIPQSDGLFIPKEISANQINSTLFEIKEGLNEGDKVVDKALFLLDSDALTNALYESEEDEDW